MRKPWRQATLRRPRRRALRGLAAWLAVQALVAVTGRVAARRLNEGDENSAGIRRVMTMGGLELRPTNPALTRVRLDLVMAGGELDLTGVSPPPGGIDLTVRAVMGGVAVRVPRGWRVWWEFTGIGGMGADTGVERTTDQVHAHLRVHARTFLGGVGIESVQS
jgi:hypothetical protein